MCRSVDVAKRDLEKSFSISSTILRDRPKTDYEKAVMQNNLIQRMMVALRARGKKF